MFEWRDGYDQHYPPDIDDKESHSTITTEELEVAELPIEESLEERPKRNQGSPITYNAWHLPAGV